MCLPVLVKLLIFAFLPMVGIIMAFQFYRPVDGLASEFIGFENFTYLFATPDAFIIFKNTILYNLLFVLTGTLVSLVLALFMFELKSKIFLKVTQTAMFFPYFASWVLAGTLVLSLLGNNGLVTMLCTRIFGENPRFYDTAKYWYFILVVVNIWKSAGVNSIIYFATLMNVDGEIFEAAEIDGAGVFTKMFWISLPQIQTMVLITMIMGCSNILRSDFGMFFYVAKGPLPAINTTTEVIDTYIYKALSSGYGGYGVGSAVSLMQGVAGLILTFLMNLASKRIDSSAALF